MYIVTLSDNRLDWKLYTVEHGPITCMPQVGLYKEHDDRARTTKCSGKAQNCQPGSKGLVP